MAKSKFHVALALAGAGLLLASSIAEAQWVMIARRAVGRVEQMSQTPPNGGPSYDSATVMLEAPPDKVYAAVVSGVTKAQGITITAQDPQVRLIQFTNGQQIAGIKISVLGDNLSQMMISSAHSGTQPDAAALVMNSVLRVCAEMKVECSKAN
jgi:hypothetical protein